MAKIIESLTDISSDKREAVLSLKSRIDAFNKSSGAPQRVMSYSPLFEEGGELYVSLDNGIVIVTVHYNPDGDILEWANNEFQMLMIAFGFINLAA